MRSSIASGAALLALILPAPGAFAQSGGTQKPAAVRVAVPSGQRMSLMEQLQQLAGKERIPVVAVAVTPRSQDPQLVLDFSGKTMLNALQNIAESVSAPVAMVPVPDDEAFIPYQLGTVWTVAPSRQWAPAPLPDGKDPLAALDGPRLLRRLVLSLSAGQLARASAGLRFSDLSPDQQAMLRTAMDRNPSVNGGALQSPFPVERSVLRLSLGFHYLTYIAQPSPGTAISATSTGDILRHPGPVLEFSSPPATPAGLGASPWVKVPARQKPSDIDGQGNALNAPIGLQGATTVGEVVAAVARATRLPIAAHPRLATLPAFVGDPALRSGDVLRTIAFGVQGAFRKVGDAYFLTWDRTGLRAVELRLSESLASLKAALPVMDGPAGPDAAWATAALESLGPDTDVPLVPTREQVAAMIASAARGGTGQTLITDTGPTGSLVLDMNGIPFTGLAPDQQDAVRRALKENTPGDSLEGRLEDATVSGLAVDGSLEAPGIGRVSLSEFGLVSIPSSALRPEAPASPATAPAAGPLPPRVAAPLDSTVDLPLGRRMLFVPQLPRGEYTRLLEQMERKGLDTLYLPVLWGGQALFPSKSFPAQPLTRGEDVLGQVLNQAKARGIYVVGVLSTLAWRNADDDETHWLRGFPDLVDTDALGRTRREWARQHPLSDAKAWPDDWTRERAAADPLLLADDVRPDAPEVRTRLMDFLAELRRYPLDGVALTGWTRATGPYEYNEVAPELGYSVPARSAFLASRGVDPLDLARGAVPFPAALTRLQMPLLEAWYKDRLSADVALASAVLSEAERAWPGHVQMFSSLHPTDQAPSRLVYGSESVSLPLPDALIVPRISVVQGRSGKPDRPIYRKVVLPPVSGPGDDTSSRLQAFAGEIGRVNAARANIPWAIPGVLLDATAAPDLLWDALRALRPSPRRTAPAAP